MLSAPERSARRPPSSCSSWRAGCPRRGRPGFPPSRPTSTCRPARWRSAIVGLEAGAIAGLPTGAALVARLGSRRALRLGFAAFAPGAGRRRPRRRPRRAGRRARRMALRQQRRRRRHERTGRGAGAARAPAAALRAPRRPPARPGRRRPRGHRGGRRRRPGAAHFAVVGGASAWPARSPRPAAGREQARGRQPAFVRPSRRLLLLGRVAFCAFALDGAAYNWSAVDLRTEHDAAAALAAAAFTGFALALAAGPAVRRSARRPPRPRPRRAGLRGRRRSRERAVVLAAPAPGSALAGWALLRPRARRRGARPCSVPRRGIGDAPPAVGDRRRHHRRLPRLVHRTAARRRARRSHQPLDGAPRARRRQRAARRARAARPRPARVTPRRTSGAALLVPRAGCRGRAHSGGSRGGGAAQRASAPPSPAHLRPLGAGMTRAARRALRPTWSAVRPASAAATTKPSS